jgi:hypothetical protein
MSEYGTYKTRIASKVFLIYLPGCHCRRLVAPVRFNVPPIIEVFLGFSRPKICKIYFTNK